MKKPTKLSLLLTLIVFAVQLAYAARVERLIDSWQPKHYAINITLNDQLSEIVSATTRIDIQILKPTTLIDLDFGDTNHRRRHAQFPTHSIHTQRRQAQNHTLPTRKARRTITNLRPIPRQTKRWFNPIRRQRRKTFSRRRQLAQPRSSLDSDTRPPISQSNCHFQHHRARKQ